MLSSRRLTHSNAHGSADLARHRLLTDRTTRKGRAHRPAPRPAGLVPPLSPADQWELAQEIAARLADGYLSHTTYLDDADLTVATLRSRTPLPGGTFGVQRICVDCAGNVSITSWQSHPDASRPTLWLRRFAPAFMLLVFVVATVITLL